MRHPSLLPVAGRVADCVAPHDQYNPFRNSDLCAVTQNAGDRSAITMQGRSPRNLPGGRPSHGVAPDAIVRVTGFGIDRRGGSRSSSASLNAPMTPYEFIAKWQASTLTERSASHQHFLDLCDLLDEPKPADADPSGETYCFERGARKDSGGDGWADVWKRHHFAWEYKGKRANLDAAFEQLRQYALALENPPLLIVSDMLRFRIRTNWTNSVSQTHEFNLDDLADAATRDRLKWAFSNPERLRPGETRQSLTERVAASFASVAQALRERGHNPQAVAHFVNRLVFCMFADDVGLLPGHMFTRMLEQARRTPAHFADLAADLFHVMAKGGRVGFETVDWFNGGLFDDGAALPLEKSDIDTVLAASNLDWSDIDPSILGTLFERGLDPGKRAQLGAHYTDRDKIMLLVEPVVIRPWLAEWAAEKIEISGELERAEATKSRAARTRRHTEAERRYRAFLNRLRAFTVLDPACARATSSTSPSMRSRTWSTGCRSRRRHWASSVHSRKSARPTSRASRSTPTPPNWPGSRSGSARSSGCGATASRKRATRS